MTAITETVTPFDFSWLKTMAVPLVGLFIAAGLFRTGLDIYTGNYIGAGVAFFVLLLVIFAAIDGSKMPPSFH